MASGNRVRSNRLATASLWGSLLLSSWLGLDGVAQQPAERAADRPVGLTVLGAESFTPDQIKAAALRSAALWKLAAQANGSAREKLEALRSAVEQAYYHLGYRKVRVRASLEPNRRTLRIEEGPKFRCGQVRVEGLPAPAAKRLATLLSQGLVPGNGEDELKPIWRAGKTPPRQLRTRLALTAALEELGYSADRVNFREDQRAGALLDLVVELKETPPVRKIASVLIEGNVRNSTEAIRTLTGLRKGERWTGALRRTAAQRLRDTGRFREVRVIPGVSDFEHGVPLRVQVLELEEATPLGQSLSKEEEALRKAAVWVGRDASERFDTVVTFGPLEVVVSPQDGVLIARRDQENGARTPRLAAVASAGAIHAFNLDAGTRIELQMPETRLDVVVNCQPDTETGRFIRLKLGVSWRTREPEESPFGLRLQIAPALLTQLASQGKTSWDGKIMSQATDHSEIVIDSVSGRVLKYWDSKSGTRVAARFEAGYLRKRLAKLRATATGHRSAFDPQKSITSAVKFFCDPHWRRLVADAYPAAGAGTSPAAVFEALAALAEAGGLSGLDEVVVRWKADELALAVDGDQLPSDAVFVAMLIDQFVGPQTMAWVALRAIWATRGQYRATAMAAWTQLAVGSRTGPVVAQMMSELLSLWNLRPIAQRLGRLALERNDLEHFRREYREILHPANPAGRMLWGLARAARKLEDRHLVTLTAWIPDTHREPLLEVLNHLRENPEQPLAEALPAALERVWESTLRLRADAAAATGPPRR